MVTQKCDHTWKALQRTDGTVTYVVVHAVPVPAGDTVSAEASDIDGAVIPASVAAALHHPRWKSAMDSEFSALQQNKTWRLVPFWRGLNVIDSR
jgi:hypothetical protein